MKSVDFTCNINDPAYKCGYEEGYRIGCDDIRKQRLRLIGFPIDNAFKYGMVEGYMSAHHISSIDFYIDLCSYDKEEEWYCPCYL